MTQLHEFPPAIYKARTDVNELDSKIFELRAAIAQLENQADAETAFDPSFKNDQQRKAGRWQMLNAKPEYVLMQTDLTEACNERAAKTAVLELVLNEFSVAKIQARQVAAMTLMSQRDNIEALGLSPDSITSYRTDT